MSLISMTPLAINHLLGRGTVIFHWDYSGFFNGLGQEKRFEKSPKGERRA
jgi:hypothetical protein